MEADVKVITWFVLPSIVIDVAEAAFSAMAFVVGLNCLTIFDTPATGAVRVNVNAVPALVAPFIVVMP